ncbi:MAG: AzlC family ABC transporter permease [Bacillota bacterium]|nr:AzlC family ABC transporter permease [Bacillota bacterium]
MNTKHMKSGLKDSVPIVVGYIPIAIAFGLLSKTSGIPMIDTALMSLLVFAGASQFMAVNLIASGVGIGEIIIATFLLNFRHLLMSASLSSKLGNINKRWNAAVAFGVTDEVFSVASFKKEGLSVSYMLVLQLASYSSWVGGSLLGFVIGQALPQDITLSMGVALYAMFAALLMPEVRERYSVGLLAAFSAVINTVLCSLAGVSKGWSIVASIVVTSAVGASVFRDENEEVAAVEE